MRLQLSISRHTLPPTHILFSTASHPSAHTSSRNATIADLLHDINELVPLESEDGEWGLEDYVVEVAATADQDNVYEALHFQSIDSVLREDDEVEIRYLKSEELKGRRYGGRLQITGDGRHLVDGVVWGRRWLGAARAGARPGVEIPPRKRRRILATEEEDDMQAEEPLLALIGQAEQDDMDDDDYAEEEDANQVKVITAFEDADQADSENDDDEMEDVEEDEVQLLLQEAAEVEDALDACEAVLESQLRSRTRLGKRKRIFEDENVEADFQGFSTPVKSPASRQVQFEGVGSDSDSDGDSMLVVNTTEQAQKVRENQLPEEDVEDSPDSDFESSSDSSPAESEDDSASDVNDESPRLRRSRRHEVKTSDTSGSGTSESESEDSDSSDSSSETSSSGTSESESESSETSSSYDSNSEVKRSTKTAAVKTTLSPHTSKPIAASQQPLNKQAGSAAPPGQGKASTRRKNQRVKMVRQLKRLKEEGRLPADADLDALRAYEASAGQSQPQSTADETQLEAARIKALANVQALEAAQVEEGEVDNDSPEPSRETESYQPTAESEAPEASVTVQPTQEAPQSAPSSSVKRSRLDVAASRRLLFGSLGLRAPKTPAEEQTLREKLDKSAKQRPADRRAERSNSPPPEETSQDVSDSWREKLIISAIECTKEGLKLDPPPFPFQQYSTMRKLNVVDQEPELDYGDAEPTKPEQQPDMRFQDVPDPAERLKLKKLHASLPNFTVRECYEALQACEWNHDDARELLFEAEASQPLGGQPTASATQDSHRAGEVSDNGSRTVSFAKDEADGMPIPTDFAALIDLGTEHLLPGAVVAYKELWVDPATLQPDVSPYRVARILECDGEDFITVVLAIKDRNKPRPRDPDTGEVIISGFEIQSSEDDEPDEGIRELRFADMVTPKLVETPVQIPGSSAVTNLRGGHIADDDHHQSSEVVPDSAPSAQNKDSIPLPKVEVQQVEIDTPRRAEITTMIKEAGFNSAMDEDLLEPLSARVNRSPASSRPEFSRENNTSIVVEIPSQPAIVETSQVQTNGWNSSPLFPPQESMPANADEEGITLSDNVQPTSSPPVSPQLTVEYPHISQMDLDSSYRGPEESSKNSSSHQDAQRVPAVAPADVTLTVTEEDEQGLSFDDDGDVSFDDEPMNELQSEVPQSQSQEPSNLQPLAEPDDDDASTPRVRSFLGRRGTGGPTSSPSFRSSDDDLDVPERDGSGSESSLPSLTELTSRQRRKIKPATTRSSLNQHVSPPPVSNKGLKHKDLKDKISKTRKSSTPPTKLQNSFDGANDDADLDHPPSSQVEPASSIDPLQRDIKIAPSQKEKRMSQIPLGTQVVDLTISSDPVSPSDSDSDYGVKNQRSTLKGRKPNGKAKGKKSMLGTSMSDLGAGTGVGIGTRRFLTSKKSRSQI